MLSSIHPFGERARNNRWGVTAGFYLFGSTLGGAAIGAVAGLVGWPIRALIGPGATLVGGVVLGICASCLVVELTGLRLPTIHRQVDEDWLNRYRGWVYGVGFGFQLGLGVVTIVRTATVYAVVLIAVMTGSVAGGAVVGATFGLARALPILAVGGVRRPDQLRRVHLSMQHLGPAFGRAASLAMALLVALGTAWVA